MNLTDVNNTCTCRTIKITLKAINKEKYRVEIIQSNVISYSFI